MNIIDQQVKALIHKELDRQRRGIELIASENFASYQVVTSMGSWLTNKYAEGYPGKRYYGGCEVVDEIESLAIERLCKLFGADFANVQPHSGAQANMAVQLSILKPGDTLLGLDLAHGGHLSHGSPVNMSGKYYTVVSYGLDSEGRVDLNQVRELALKHKPKLIICGASAYSRDWDYQTFRSIADEIDATLLADIAHPAGLIVSKQLNNPIPHCHIITSTTHKTLRGPRGGIIVMGKDFPNRIGKKDKKGNTIPMSNLLNSAVFPGIQGGPLEHIIASKAIAFGEALDPSFTIYSKQVIQNAAFLSQSLVTQGLRIVSGGTDNHLMLVDLQSKNITGKEAENLLIKADITTNKNMIPNDPQPANTTSGIRLGTAAMTSRGFKETDFAKVSEWITRLIERRNDESFIHSVKLEINEYMRKFPLYPEVES
ncbi:MAG: serine hydroxymethyltransferase [Saprospiraceae bacterium]|nr:serine hydroxymethyltransferase [Saprospiraceae bacterium]